MMNRRDFLKFLGASTAIIAAPSVCFGSKDFYSYEPKENAYENFNPKHKYGNAMILSVPFEKLSVNDRMKLYEVMERDIAEGIPPKYRHKVEFIFKSPGTSGEISSIAWKYKP